MSLASIISFLSSPGSVVAGGALGAAVSGWTLWARSRRTDGRALVTARTMTFTGREQPGVAKASQFVDWLAELPLRDWLELGGGIAGDGAQSAARRHASDGLQVAISDHGLQVAAWYVRDAVETAAFLASHSMHRWSPQDRRFFAAARRSAETAALALLARPFLDAAHLTSLYGVFQERQAAAASMKAQGTVAFGRTG